MKLFSACRGVACADANAKEGERKAMKLFSTCRAVACVDANGREGGWGDEAVFFVQGRITQAAAV